MNIRNTKITLASQSPRRLQLLEALGFQVIVKTATVTEDFPDEMLASAVPEYLAIKKVNALLSADENSQSEIVIGADTIVVLENEILGKPEDAAAAIHTLTRLSGKSHEVISGVCISYKGTMTSFSTITKVYFKPLIEDEIAYYVSNYHTLDKAGAYAIQEWIGMIGIEKIVGDYYNVMGLPVHNVYEILKQYEK